MQLTQKQAEVIQNKSRFKVLNWGRRSGKTTLLAYEALGTALTINNAKITYYAQTRDDARDISWDIFKEVFGDAVLKTNETLLELTIANLKGGTSRVSLKGWEAVVTGNKGRGTENNLILCDEVAYCRGFLPFYEKVLEPTLLTTGGRTVFSSTPNGFNDFYELSNKAQRSPDWMYSHATSYDNPHNPATELDKLRTEKTPDRFAQEYMADFRKQEGLVYKEFSRVTHVFKELPNVEFVSTFGGHDFGTTNPCASITIKKDRDARYWITDEWYKTGMTDAQQADYVQALKWDKCYPDPESASGILEMKRRGINVREVVKNKDSVKNGINTIRELLMSNRLKIHESCTNLIWEFETYSYPEKRPNRNEDENPIKENDHALDSIRYALSMDNVLTTRKYYPVNYSAPKPKGNIAL